MATSLKFKHLKRYKDIALLLIKYGRSDVVKHVGLQDVLEPDASVETTTGPSKADELAKDLEKMGPTFIKLGQLLSTRADFSSCLSPCADTIAGQNRSISVRTGGSNHFCRTGGAHLKSVFNI